MAIKTLTKNVMRKINASISPKAFLRSEKMATLYES